MRSRYECKGRQARHKSALATANPVALPAKYVDHHQRSSEPVLVAMSPARAPHLPVPCLCGDCGHYKPKKRPFLA